ncbi:hypothetical protein DV872_16975 [Oceanispirochaeta sp. M1]|nr:hypothetical protein DV872_16975 [Oceanispirochaeta sp. M1]
MQDRISQKYFERTKRVQKGKEKNAVAMKEWAIEMEPTIGGNVLMEFSGKSLLQGESDASSFPSGDLEETFEARGYVGPNHFEMAKIFCTANIASDNNQNIMKLMGRIAERHDLRLGGHEGSPSIIRVYLADTLTGILDNYAAGEKTKTTNVDFVRMGTSNLPRLFKDSTDRNRTSPFAFNGNKYKFIMVPSSGSIAEVIRVLKTIVADVLSDVKKQKFLKLFKRQNALTGKELESRFNIAVEKYIKELNIKTAFMIEMGKLNIESAVRAITGALTTSLSKSKGFIPGLDTHK